MTLDQQIGLFQQIDVNVLNNNGVIGAGFVGPNVDVAATQWVMNRAVVPSMGARRCAGPADRRFLAWPRGRAAARGSSAVCGKAAVEVVLARAGNAIQLTLNGIVGCKPSVRRSGPVRPP